MIINYIKQHIVVYALRWGLMIAVICGAYMETGKWTTIALSFIFISAEINAIIFWLRIKANRPL